MEILPKVKEYLNEARAPLPPISGPDMPLRLDSLAVSRFVTFLENELGYRIEDEELIEENFTTLRKVADLLATKTPMSIFNEPKNDT